jgi:hypothetical protein
VVKPSFQPGNGGKLERTILSIAGLHDVLGESGRIRHHLLGPILFVEVLGVYPSPLLGPTRFIPPSRGLSRTDVIALRLFRFADERLVHASSGVNVKVPRRGLIAPGVVTGISDFSGFGHPFCRRP